MNWTQMYWKVNMEIKEFLEDEIKFLKSFGKHRHRKFNGTQIKQLRKERGDNCGLCTVKIANQQHHIIPRRHKGSDKPENLILLCTRCHGIIESLLYSGDMKSKMELNIRRQELQKLLDALVGLNETGGKS